MAKYKTIAGPVGLTIDKNGVFEDAVRQYAEIINREAAGGWEFVMCQDIPVTQNPGCLAYLFGRRGETIHFNMLVFVRHD